MVCMLWHLLELILTTTGYWLCCGIYWNWYWQPLGTGYAVAFIGTGIDNHWLLVMLWHLLELILTTTGYWLCCGVYWNWYWQPMGIGYAMAFIGIDIDNHWVLVILWHLWELILTTTGYWLQGCKSSSSQYMSFLLESLSCISVF